MLQLALIHIDFAAIFHAIGHVIVMGVSGGMSSG